MNNNSNTNLNNNVQSTSMVNQVVNSDKITKPKKKNKSKKKLILLIGGLVIIVILVIIILLLVFNKKKNSNTAEPVEVVQTKDDNEQSETEVFTYKGLAFEMVKGYDYKTDNNIISIIKNDKKEMYLLSLVKYNFSKIKEEDFLKQLELEGYKAENVKKEKYNKQEIMTAEISTDSGNKFIAFMTSSTSSNYSFYGIAVKSTIEYDYKLIKSVQKIISLATEFDSIKGQKFLESAILSKYSIVIQQIDTVEPTENNNENVATNISGAAANSVLDNDSEDEYEEYEENDDSGEEETDYEEDEEYDDEDY